MISQSDLSTYLYQLQQYIAAQSKKIQHLEQSIAIMQTDINQLKKKPSTNVERIEYKFDQLKIETLEGTLNIGLNPSDLNSMDELSVEQSGISTPSMSNPKHAYITNQIKDKVNHYLDEECFDLIRNLEKENNRDLGESYHHFIVEDVRKQINQRITFYTNQYMPQLNSDESENYQEIIYQKVKEDIKKSFTAFLNNLPNDVKGGIFNEFYGH
jgi:spore germination protein PC